MNLEIANTPEAALQDQSLERLKRGDTSETKGLTEAKRKEIKKVSRDFEALFMGMMLKSMRETVPENKMFGGGKAEETYRFMLDQEYVNAAAKRGGLGISQMVEKAVLKRYGAPSATTGSRNTDQLPSGGNDVSDN